ncbi:hypothetical protein INR49_025141 [Caranx melampygus]|nr:hypothetical protein INR49_025141 [Caranx melampygus]
MYNAPSPVTVIKKEKTSRNSVSLSWQEPERPNGIILDYEIKYYEKEEQETSYTILRARGCNVTLNGLKPNTAYLLQIRARTAAGYGASSPSFQFETSPDSAFSISSESSQVVLIAISSAVAIILLTVLLYVLIGRTYVDPHTYEDPSQAVHEFAKELDASCIAIDKVVGAATLYQLMLDCWQKERNNRPKFEQIVSILDKLIRNPGSLKITANTTSRPANLLLDRSSSEAPSMGTMGDWMDGMRTLPCKEAFSGVSYSSCDTLAKTSTDHALNVASTVTTEGEVEWFLRRSTSHPLLAQNGSHPWGSPLSNAQLLSASSGSGWDLKKVGVTIVGPQKKIVSSLKALDSHTKNGPVPV